MCPRAVYICVKAVYGLVRVHVCVWCEQEFFFPGPSGSVSHGEAVKVSGRVKWSVRELGCVSYCGQCWHYIEQKRSAYNTDMSTHTHTHTYIHKSECRHARDMHVHT